MKIQNQKTMEKKKPQAYNVTKLPAIQVRIFRACLAACICLSIFTLSACTSSENKNSTEIKIGTLATEDILPFWVAESENLFVQENVNASIEVFQSATELIAAVGSGDVQFAMTDPMVSASIYSSGTDVQIEWVTLGTQASQGVFGIMSADASIKSLKDLAGVEIGVGSNTILEYVMDTLMENAGIPESKIEKNELQKLPVRYEAMASGQVKAAALPASLLALGKANGCHVIADDSTGKNISQSVMIARNDAVADVQGQETLQALKRVWNKAASEINANPNSYRTLLAQKANLSEEIAENYEISEYPQCELPSNKMIEPVLSWMLKKGYLQNALYYNEEDGTFSNSK